jgi:hypothetical protein
MREAVYFSKTSGNASGMSCKARRHAGGERKGDVCGIPMGLGAEREICIPRERYNGNVRRIVEAVIFCDIHAAGRLHLSYNSLRQRHPHPLCCNSERLPIQPLPDFDELPFLSRAPLLILLPINHLSRALRKFDSQDKMLIPPAVQLLTRNSRVAAVHERDECEALSPAGFAVFG